MGLHKAGVVAVSTLVFAAGTGGAVAATRHSAHRTATHTAKTSTTTTATTTNPCPNMPSPTANG